MPDRVSHVELVDLKIPKSIRPQNAGKSMAYFLLMLVALFAGDVSSAYADPIPTFHVTDATMQMFRNPGT